jgi:hypothetical protein
VDEKWLWGAMGVGKISLLQLHMGRFGRLEVASLKDYIENITDRT